MLSASVFENAAVDMGLVSIVTIDPKEGEVVRWISPEDVPANVYFA